MISLRSTRWPRVKCNYSKVFFLSNLKFRFSTNTSQDELSHSRTDKLEKQYKNEALNATGIGAVINALFAASKGIIGYSVGSTALIADCFNSCGDLFSDAVVYYTVTEARKKATRERPWGSGKLEPLGAFVVGGLLGVTGSGIALTAVYSILDLTQLFSGETFHMFRAALPAVESADWRQFSSSLTTHEFAALAISGVSIISKELLFRYTLRAGKLANSDAVIANAWQHRSDVFVSAAVFAGLTGSYLGYPILDPLAGLLVSGVILKQAVSIGRKSLHDLSDAPAAEEETQALRQTCLCVPGIKSVVDLKARQSGPFLFVECTVGVRGELSASAAHRLAELVRVELMRRHRGRVANAVVDVDPLGSTGLGELTSHTSRSPDEITKEVKRTLLQLNGRPSVTPSIENGWRLHGRRPEEFAGFPPLEDEDLNFNNLRHITSVSEVIVYYKDDGRISLKVDVCMDPDLTIRKAHKVAVMARRHLMEQIEGLGQVDVDLELEDEGENVAVQGHLQGSSESGQVKVKARC